MPLPCPNKCTDLCTIFICDDIILPNAGVSGVYTAYITASWLETALTIEVNVASFQPILIPTCGLTPNCRYTLQLQDPNGVFSSNCWYFDLKRKIEIEC